MTVHYLYIVLMFVALIAVMAMFYLSKVSFKEMFVTRPWKANDNCLIQYERKVVSTLAHIMAEQAAKGRGAIKTAPSTEYLRLVKQILFLIESHDIGDKVQEKTTIPAPEFKGSKWITWTGTPPGLADSTPASTSTCATTNASVYALADDSDVAYDKREQPHPGLAEGPRQPRELQQGPPTSRERPNKGSAEDLEQPIKLQQGVPQLHHWLSKQTDVPVKPLRVHEELGYFNVDHFRSGCYYNDGNFASGSDFNDDTFKDRCYYNVDIFKDGGCKHPVQPYLRGRWLQASCPTIASRTVATSILSNDTFEYRCYFSIGTFENWCNESNPSKRGLLMTTFQLRQCLREYMEDQEPPYNLFLQSRTHVVLEEQEEEKESPSFGRCRPLC